LSAVPVALRFLRKADPKRVLDTVVSVVLLVVLIPLFVTVAAAVKLDTRGSVLFRCRRVGFRGAKLWMLKFRKMREGASGAAVTASADSRLTRVGRVLARTKLDELPQLWNVLRGEMSLVGPRPESPEFVELHSAGYRTILTVKPGITGLCQLAFARESEILDGEDPVRDYIDRLLPQKIALDQLYVRSRSMQMDLRILAWTALAVLFRREVAVHRDSGKLSLRKPRLQRSPEVAATGIQVEA
jgi:lipopolysaccharide/colanic/teichoic acid biosynthesis glycosyltransferase